MEQGASRSGPCRLREHSGRALEMTPIIRSPSAKRGAYACVDVQPADSLAVDLASACMPPLGDDCRRSGQAPIAVLSFGTQGRIVIHLL
jgi:hypothetical protein